MADLRSRLTRSQILEDTYAKVEAAALAGTLPSSSALPELARMGRLRIEILSHNWRVVTIMEGPHRGKQTAQPPRGGRVYRVIDKDTTWRAKQGGEPGSRSPSAPRPLSRGEIDALKPGADRG